MPFHLDTLSLVLFAVGMAVGSYSSVVGGGALVLVPFFTLVGAPLTVAIATMRLSSVFQQFVCILAFGRKKRLRWDTALWASVWSMPGAYVGARLVIHIDQRLLSYIIAGIMVLLLFLTPRFKKTKPIKRIRLHPKYFALAVACFVLGIYGGFYGAGFSTMLMFLFAALSGVDIITASGNSSVATFFMAIAASIPFLKAHLVDWQIFYPITAGGLIGSWLGVECAVKFGWRWIQVLLAIVVVASVLKLVFVP